VILHSGAWRTKGAGPSTRRPPLRNLLLDEHGNPINKRNRLDGAVVAYVRLIPPGAATTVHYRLRIPDDCGGTIRLRAKVNYRNSRGGIRKWAFAGVRDPADPEPSVGPGPWTPDDGRWIFTGDTSACPAASRPSEHPHHGHEQRGGDAQGGAQRGALARRRALLDESVRERWNDYGIGLLLQGDLKGAEAAFEKVTVMEPEYADGWVNVGRARIQEGNMEGAEESCAGRWRRAPGWPRTHFFLATALKARGRYDEALAHLRTAAERYPRDRVVRNQIGRVLFLKRQYKEAITELQKVLEIDPRRPAGALQPDALLAGPREADKARRAQALYVRFKADESAQAITGPYRQLHPDDNNRAPGHPRAPHGGALADADRRGTSGAGR